MNSPVTILVLVGAKEQVSSDWNITIHIIATNNGTLDFGVPGMRCMQILTMYNLMKTTLTPLSSQKNYYSVII